MPLTCKGRTRGVDASRGDIDDALGNFSLTLVDTLDSLAVLGKVDEFVEAVQLVVANVKVRCTPLIVARTTLFCLRFTLLLSCLCL